jgi:hypothetical protein
MRRSAIHRDVRTAKYRMRVIANKRSDKYACRRNVKELRKESEHDAPEPHGKEYRFD